MSGIEILNFSVHAYLYMHLYKLSYYVTVIISDDIGSDLYTQCCWWKYDEIHLNTVVCMTIDSCSSKCCENTTPNWIGWSQIINLEILSLSRLCPCL